MFRTTFYFAMDSQGWSETLYRNAAFSAGDRILLDNYINARLMLLASSTTMISVRTSNMDTKRDISIVDIGVGGRQGSWAYGGSGTAQDPGTATVSEDTFTALLLRLSDGQQNYRSFPMLGFPDHVLVGNTIVPGERALVNNRLNAWIGAITQASFGGRFQSGTTVTGRVNMFSPKEADNQLVCLGLKGGVPAVGTIVTLNGVKPFRALNRQWRVAATAAGDAINDGYIYLAGSEGLNAFGPVQGGTYKSATYAVNVLNQYTISRLTMRKTGVPFDTVRGRR